MTYNVFSGTLNLTQSIVINSGIWLVSVDCLNTLIMMKPVTENVVVDLRLTNICHMERAEGMIRTHCHTVVKALVKFMLVAHGGHV